MYSARLFFIILLISGFSYLTISPIAARTTPLIIDHTSVALFDQIPPSAFTITKNSLRVMYQHTSHGTQLVSGTNLLNDWPDYNYSVPNCTGYLPLGSNTDFCNDLSFYNNQSTTKAPLDVLSFIDGIPSIVSGHSAADLGNPNYTNWAIVTRDHLSNTSPYMKPNDRNVIMWSWCGQVSSATAEIIARDYLGQMNQLELDYPNVNFIYMTGHLDSTYTNGNLHQRNEQIRAYARANNKILYDFADIERYDPHGTDYLDLGAGDNADGCDYDTGNWCASWCSSHSCPTCVSCAHSHCFNCYQKGKALWVMLAQLAGWDPSGSIPDPTPTPMPYDFNTDGDTDYLDLTSLISSFNQIFRNELISIFSFNRFVGNL